MKLASFIVLSAGLHGAVLAYPIFFPGSEREQLLPATIISGDEEGGARGKSTAVGNKAQGSAPRTTTAVKTSDRQVTGSGKWQGVMARGRQGVKSFVASCWFLLEPSLTRLAHDEIHFAGLSTTSDA